MAAAGSVAVLLPGAFYFLRETRLPPVAALRAAGVPIAIATDHNPGSSPTLSPLLMLNMACTLFRLTPEEALRGMTANGARALGLADRGTLAAGSARRLRGLERRPSERARLLVRPQPVRSRRRRRRRAAARMSDPVFTLERGTHAAPAQPAARRHRDRRRRRSLARAARARARGHRLAPRRGLRLRARARRERARAALLALRRRSQPAAGERADVPRREQHRARADALLHRRRALSRRSRSRRARDRAARRRLLAAVPRRARRRARASRRRARPRGAVGRAQHPGRGAVAVRRTAPRSQPRHRRAAPAARRRCAPR